MYQVDIPIDYQKRTGKLPQGLLKRAKGGGGSGRPPSESKTQKKTPDLEKPNVLQELIVDATSSKAALSAQGAELDEVSAQEEARGSPGSGG